MPTNIIDYFGLDPKQFPRRLLGSEQGHCLLVGSGRNVWDEVRGLCLERHVICVNDMGMYWPGYVKHWYSNDTEQLIHWSEGRRRPLTQLWGRGWKLHSCFKRNGPEYEHVNYWPVPGQGSSGLVAILVALLLGYDDVTVAGVPLDNSGHFYDPPYGHPLSHGREWSNFLNETTDRILERSLPLFKGKVHALSGRLREELGG